MPDAASPASGAPARRGRPPALTRDGIARAVLETGFANLTFAAVRERLGVGESTLFRYAKDRDELVRIGLDYAVERVVWPPLDGPWRSMVEDFALTSWRTMELHPGSATEIARGVIPHGMLDLMDDLCAQLMRQGFTVENAVLACDVVFDLVTDNRRGVEHLDAVVPGGGPGRDHVQELWQEASASGGRAASATTEAEREAIHATIRAAITTSPVVWFADKLRVVLDGVEHSLAP